MEKYAKYPRTYHLPWSPGVTRDDRVCPAIDDFQGREIVVTEKLDGENTTLYADHIHARSVESKHHASQAWVKSLHGRIRHEIPVGMRVCGESMYARHSIHYRGLTSYFYVFAVFDSGGRYLSWDETVECAARLGLETVPMLYRGSWDEKAVKACWTGRSAFDGEQEGYVVRIAEAFPDDVPDRNNFSRFSAKYVRIGHGQTDDHWLRQAVVPNLLKTSA